DPDGGARALERLAAQLAGLGVVESLGEGEFACLVEADVDLDQAVTWLRRADPDATVTAARYPEGGQSLAQLLTLARQLARDDDPADVGSSDGIVVADPAMAKVLQVARRIAKAPTTVLLLGETGVGKEIVAEHIHRAS